MKDWFCRWSFLVGCWLQASPFSLVGQKIF